MEIWNQWLYQGTDERVRLRIDSGVHSYADSCNKMANKIKLNVSNDMYRNCLDYHTPVW